jgi:hypothetical protein
MSKGKLSKLRKVQKSQINKSSVPTKTPSLTGLKKYWGTILTTLILLTAGFSTIPNLLQQPYNSIESSWLIGLNMAKVLGLQFGKDIVFPFGPLGFMYHPVYCEFNTWLISAVVCLFAHCLLIFSIILMLKRLSASLVDCVLMGLVLMFALPQISIEYKLLFPVLILLYLSIVTPFKLKTQLTLYVFASFVMAAAGLIKFTATLISISTLMFMIVFCLYKKQLSYLFCVLFSYIFSTLILLAASGQRIVNFPSYLLNGYRVADGYSSAMGISGPGTQVFAGFCILALFAFLLFHSILTRRQSLIYFILIIAGFIFVSFKHGLVRHDASHLYILFANALLVFYTIYATNKKQLTLLTGSLILTLVSVLAALIFVHSPRQIIPDVPGKLKMIGSAASLAFDDAADKARILEDGKSEMRKAGLLREVILQYVGNKSVDLMPWEISLAYAYNLNWSPRPVFQCYGVWTDKLDMLNSKFFESNNAPEVLLYAIGGIDGKYPLFDAPATFITILRNYEPVLISGMHLVLQKSSTRNLPPPKTISVLESQLDKPIPVPQTNGYLFAKIYMDYNLLGKIAKLFYKPPIVNIALKTNSTIYQARLVFSAAKNGISLSQKPIYSLKEAFDLWSGNLDNAFKSIVISAENPHFYGKRVKVEFFEIPKSINQTPTRKLRHITE